MRNCLAQIVSVLSAVALTGCAVSTPAVTTSGKSAQKADHQSAALTAPRENIITLDERKEKLADIQIEPVSARAADEVIELSSTVESPSDATGIVYSPVNGVVNRVLADVGDRVAAGQIVAYVNSPDISDAQSAALNALARYDEAGAHAKLIETRLQLAHSNENRLVLLQKEGIAARKDVEAAKSNVAAIEAELVAAKTSRTAAQAQLEAARVKLHSLGLKDPSRDRAEVTSELPVRSPISGTVTQRNVNPGQSVGPTTTAAGGKSAALFTVANLSTVWVMLEVPQAEVSKLKLGTRVDFRSEVAPGEHFAGTVTRLGENFDALSRTVQVRTQIDNRRQVLKPGMLVIATARGVRASAGKLAVPLSAVQSVDGKDAVFIALPDHRFQLRNVTLADRSNKLAWISAGLSPGETVVTSGSFFLKTEAMKASISGSAQ